MPETLQTVCLRGRYLEITGFRPFSRQRLLSLATATYRDQGYLVMEREGERLDDSPDLVAEQKDSLILVWCLDQEEQPIGSAVLVGIASLLADEEGAAGVVLTAGSFSVEAEDLALRSSLTLIDGRRLPDFLAPSIRPL